VPKDYQKAVELFRKAVKQGPSPNAFNDFAWFLATCPDQSQRKGKDAVFYANKACQLSGWKDANFIGTLAAAFGSSQISARKDVETFRCWTRSCDSNPVNGVPSLTLRQLHLTIIRLHLAIYFLPFRGKNAQKAVRSFKFEKRSQLFFCSHDVSFRSLVEIPGIAICLAERRNMVLRCFQDGFLGHVHEYLGFLVTDPVDMLR
jgi:hypothetical protein